MTRSALIERYYGVMAGFFQHLLVLDVPYHIYSSHRLRLLEVYQELEVDVALPMDHSSYVAQWAALTNTITMEFKLLGGSIVDFFALGHYALQLSTDPDRNGKASQKIWSDFKEIVDQYQLDSKAIGELLVDGWANELIDDALYTELVSRMYRLAVYAIWPLPKEEQTCFVIMPFSSPFREYYLTFYLPAIRAAGYHGIRAWVGLTNEHYLTLMATVMSRCGAALADVSAERDEYPNLNVIHEVGLNMGLANLTFLIQQPNKVDLPSNFTGLPIVEYQPDAVDFPGGEALRVAETLKETVR